MREVDDARRVAVVEEEVRALRVAVPLWALETRGVADLLAERSILVQIDRNIDYRSNATGDILYLDLAAGGTRSIHRAVENIHRAVENILLVDIHCSTASADSNNILVDDTHELLVV